MKRSLILLLTPLFLFSCEKVMQVTLPYEGNKFVLYSELSPSNVVQVQIQRTFPPTGSVHLDNSFLDTALVVLFENDSVLDTLVRQNKSDVFISPKAIKPQERKSYRIRVSAPGFETAESLPEVIPPLLTINSYVFTENEVISPFNPRTPTKFFEIRFSSPPQNVDWFTVEIVPFSGSYSNSANIISDLYVPDFGNACVYSYTSRLKIYNSSCFNKEYNKLGFFVEMEGAIQDRDPQFPPGGAVTSLHIKISSAGKMYPEFYQNLHPTEDLFKVFETVQPTVSNVTNGYGAILGKNETIVKVNAP
jgi:hypothetical protein